MIQLEDLAKKISKSLLQVTQEEAALEEGIHKFNSDFVSILADAWEEDRA